MIYKPSPRSIPVRIKKSCRLCDSFFYTVGAPRGPMSVSLEKQIKDRHGYVAVFLYMICQGASFF